MGGMKKKNKKQQKGREEKRPEQSEGVNLNHPEKRPTEQKVQSVQEGK